VLASKTSRVLHRCITKITYRGRRENVVRAGLERGLRQVSGCFQVS
jgi:hypothetical protein